MKKGQITIFIMIGLIIVFTAGAFMLNNKPELPDSSGFTRASEVFFNYIDECLEQTTRNGVEVLGLNSILVEDYVNENIISCINIPFFESQGLKIAHGAPLTNIATQNNTMITEMNLSVTVSRNDLKRSKEKFRFVMD